MITLEIGFPAGGRWHATAWGTHVNEGVPEWPPCPWRLCRALLSTWHWKDRSDEPVLASLLDKLASNLPAYRLPEASAAHTRHYMPINVGKNETRTKIFDTFVHVGTSQLLGIRWDVQLSAEEQSLLARLVSKINYLGRAESLVEINLVEAAASEDGDDNRSWVQPHEVDALPSDTEGEPIRLLAPRLPADYANWRDRQSGAAIGKRSPKKGTLLPESLLEAMRLDTDDWRKSGWEIPPGARWVDYTRPRDCFKIAPVRLPTRNLQQAVPVTIARFQIVSNVQPGITQALSLAERFHQSLCKIIDGQFSSALTGMDTNGKPLTGHLHASFLPECDHRGYITHVTLFAPEGFTPTDLHALSKLRKVWGIEGKGSEIDIVLLATGRPDDFSAASPFFRKARRWNSLTPFFPVRHPKASRQGEPRIDPESGLQVGSPEHDCLRLLALRDKNFPKSEISRIGRGTSIQVGSRIIPCLHFQRERRTGGGKRAGHRGYALELEFPEPIALPFGLGYASHFGLGLFIPVAEGCD